MISTGRFGGPSFERQQRREQSEEKDMNMTTKRKTTTGKLIMADILPSMDITICGIEIKGIDIDHVGSIIHGLKQRGRKDNDPAFIKNCRIELTNEDAKELALRMQAAMDEEFAMPEVQRSIKDRRPS